MRRLAVRRPNRPIRSASPNSSARPAKPPGCLKLLANENRLLILCRLALAREMSVNDLAEAVGLSQSALSQHLAKMREEGLLATRREAQTVFYRIADPNAARACWRCSKTSTARDPKEPARSRKGKCQTCKPFRPRAPPN